MSNYRKQLQKAQQLIKAKKKAEARDVLLNVLQQDESVIEAYWLWSLAAASPDEAREALAEVLRLDPNNSRAQKRLRQLNAKYPPKQPEGASEVAASEPATPEAALEEALEPAPRRPKKKGGISAINVMFGAIALVLLGALVMLFLTMVQIGPCEAEEWLARYDEASRGLSSALNDLVAFASQGAQASQEGLDKRITRVRAYREAIYNLWGQPCVKGVRNSALEWIDASLGAADKLVKGTGGDKVLEAVDGARNNYRRELTSLRNVAAQ